MLQRPFVTPVVLGFWLAATGWLFTAKILPTLSPGSPPGHQAFFASNGRLIPVAWTVECNNQPIGWALTRATRSHENLVFVDTRLHLDRLPWNEMLPSWASVVMQNMTLDAEKTAFDARGRLSFDQQGAIQSFASVVSLPGAREPIVLTGTVNQGRVSMFLAAGELRYHSTRELPAATMVGDEFSPLASLPGLHEGRTWSVPIYNPLRTGKSPLEFLYAEVGGEEMIAWNSSEVLARVVTYQNEPGSTRPPRCRLWVDQTGRVLRQEAALLGADLAFVRLPDDDAVRLAAAEDSAPAPEDPTASPRGTVP